MSKKRKIVSKTLRYILILIFLLAATIVFLGIAFYTSGYKINWKAGKIEKTGILVLDTKETDLAIYLDGKELKPEKEIGIDLFNATYKLTVLPGDYDLEVRKNGKKSYTQRITIEPELVTEIESVLLLPENVPNEKILEKNISQYLVSPDNKKIAYKTSDGKLFVFNVIDGKDQEFTELKLDPTATIYRWDENSEKILLKINKLGTEDYYFINSTNFKDSYLFSDKLSFFPFFNELYFNPQVGGEFIGLSKNTIYRVNVGQNSIKKIDDGIGIFVQNKDYFYYSNKSGDVVRLTPFNDNKEVIIKNFALSPDFKIRTLGGNSNMFFTNGRKLYFIKDENNLDLMDENVDGIFAEKDGHGLFYTNSFEIWYFDGIKKEKTMITRFSKEITDLQEFYEYGYLLYKQGTDINVIKKDALFSQVINNGISDVKVFDKNKILLIEKTKDLTSLRTIDLTVK